MDGLLNFSREILPANRGGQMDAPLVLTRDSIQLKSIRRP